MSLVDTLRARLQAKLDERAEKQAQLDTIISTCESEERDLNADEASEFAEARSAIQALDAERDEIAERIADLEAQAEARAAAEAMAKRIQPVAKERSVVVKSDDPVYRSDSPHHFFADAYNARFNGDPAAQERLQVHARQALEARDTGTSAYGALVVPQYLTDLFAANLRAGRPFANAIDNMTLPNDGMQLNIPRGTTATTAAIQASENAAVSETDFDETTLTVNVRTIAGQQDISRQAVERGTMVEEIIARDLIAAYHTTLDNGIINDDGTSGTHLGVLNVSGTNAVTYTDTSPTAAELYPKIADAIQQVNSNRYESANLIVMHPRRWAWLMSSLDGSSRPLVVPQANAPQNAFGVGENGYGAIVGQVMGVDVITDANIPTTAGGGTEDVIVVTRRQDNHLWEQSGAPLRFRFDEPGAANLTVKCVVYGYSAFTAGRYPTATSIISGTGLVAPTF